LPNDADTVARFYEYSKIDERLTNRVSSDYRNIARRFLKASSGMISRETVRAYLTSYIGKAPKTYNNQLDGLRAFIERFLRRPDLMDGFKKAHQSNNYEPELPTKEQLKKGFNALSDDRERAIYLFYPTAGLRNREALELTKNDIDFELRSVKSKHDTRTKKGGITFYNEECETYLKRYLASRTDNSDKVFRIGYRQFLRIWDKASKASGFRITPQVLRRWHSTELGELMVPDRFVDVFQGRAPRSVLAKHYTGKGLETLEKAYEKADLKVLG